MNNFDIFEHISTSLSAGSHVKNRVLIAIVRWEENITDAESMCNFLTEKFVQPGKSHTDVALRSRKFFLVTNSDINRQRGRLVAPLSANRVLNGVRSTDGSSIMTRHRPCYCNYCNDELYELCENKEYVDEWDIREVQFETQSSGVVTRSSELDVPEEYITHVSELVDCGSAVALATTDVIRYDFEFLKVTEIRDLDSLFTDDYGNEFVPGSTVLIGHFCRLAI